MVRNLWPWLCNSHQTTAERAHYSSGQHLWQNHFLLHSRHVSPDSIPDFSHWVLVYISDECSRSQRCASLMLDRAGCSAPTFLKSVVLKLALPLQSSSPFAQCLHTFEAFFADDNWSNMCLSGCTCLIETVKINILNMLFFQLMKHLITL